jgi:hypothetical protein
MQRRLCPWWEDCINTVAGDAVCEHVDWMKLAPDRVKRLLGILWWTLGLHERWFNLACSVTTHYSRELYLYSVILSLFVSCMAAIFWKENLTVRRRKQRHSGGMKGIWEAEIYSKCVQIFIWRPQGKRSLRERGVNIVTCRVVVG